MHTKLVPHLWCECTPTNIRSVLHTHYQYRCMLHTKTDGIAVHPAIIQSVLFTLVECNTHHVPFLHVSATCYIIAASQCACTHHNFYMYSYIVHNTHYT